MWSTVVNPNDIPPDCARELRTPEVRLRALVVSLSARSSGDSGRLVWLKPIGIRAERIVAGISVTEGIQLPYDLPEGAAWPEAVASLLRRQDTVVSWADPVVLDSLSRLEQFSYERGRNSVDVLRADESLLPALQIGGWFNAKSTIRLARRLFLRTPWLARLARALHPCPATVRFSAEVWFWAGVSSRASAAEWERLTRSSYSVLCYHRIAGRIGEEGLDWDDINPKRFHRQLRWLRWLRFTPVSADEILGFHYSPSALLGPRRYLLTADDGYVDALAVLARYADIHPLAFIVSGFARGDTPPRWLVTERGAAFASWNEITSAQAAGVSVGVHTRRHPDLTSCGPEQLQDELERVRDDFREAGIDAKPIVAYPFGSENVRVRAASRDAGYRLGYTIDAGTNGAGTDPFRLHRVMVLSSDGLLTVLWKALTGEERPAPIKRWRRRRNARERFSVSR